MSSSRFVRKLLKSPVVIYCFILLNSNICLTAAEKSTCNKELCCDTNKEWCDNDCYHSSLPNYHEETCNSYTDFIKDKCVRNTACSRDFIAEAQILGAGSCVIDEVKEVCGQFKSPSVVPTSTPSGSTCPYEDCCSINTSWCGYDCYHSSLPNYDEDMCSSLSLRASKICVSNLACPRDFAGVLLSAQSCLETSNVLEKSCPKTAEPSASPISTCRDTHKRFPIDGGKKKNCLYVFKNPSTCLHPGVTEDSCPVTCKKYGKEPCFPTDFEGEFNYQGEKVDCSWVGQNPEKYCKKNKLRALCPVTCQDYSY